MKVQIIFTNKHCNKNVPLHGIKVQSETKYLLWTQNLSGSKKQANFAMSSALALCYKPNIRQSSSLETAKTV